MRGYLSELMAHFWEERAEGFAAGTAPPLGASRRLCAGARVGRGSSSGAVCPCRALLIPPAAWHRTPTLPLPLPADLEGFLAIERRRPPCGDPQHIYNKLLFDAAAEALAAHHGQVLAGCLGQRARKGEGGAGSSGCWLVLSSHQPTLTHLLTRPHLPTRPPRRRWPRTRAAWRRGWRC